MLPSCIGQVVRCGRAPERFIASLCVGDGNFVIPGQANKVMQGLKLCNVRNSQCSSRRNLSNVTRKYSQRKQDADGKYKISVVDKTPSARITQSNSAVVTLQWSEEEDDQSTFHAIWLKHNCHCPKCKQGHSGQKIADVYNFLPAYTLKQTYIEGDSLIVEWEEDAGHVGLFPLSFLRENSYEDEAREKDRQARKPPFLLGGEIPVVQCDDIMKDEKALLQWLLHLNEVGFCLVKGVPSKPGAIKDVVERIWPIQHTIYGEIFDVVCTPTPINIAYSSVGLPYHMDLVYYESPPGIQFLHCLQLDSCVVGGENHFLDTFLIAEQFREKYPSDFDTLVRVPASFQKYHFDREKPVSMSYERPHIMVSKTGDIIGVNWAPAFEGPLRVSPKDVVPYYEAYQKFASTLRDSEARVTYRMGQGDMVSFNNRRVLHARAGFELHGGTRHLQGCYINIDEFRSRFEVMSKLHGDGRPSKRVANNDFK